MLCSMSAFFAVMFRHYGWLCHSMRSFHLHSTVKIQPFPSVSPLADFMAKVFGWLFLWNFKKKASAIFYGTAFPCMKPFSSAARIPVRLAPHISSGGPRDGSLRMKRRTPPISMSRYGSPPRPPGILFRPYPASKKGFIAERNIAIPAGNGQRPTGER